MKDKELLHTIALSSHDLVLKTGEKKIRLMIFGMKKNNKYSCIYYKSQFPFPTVEVWVLKIKGFDLQYKV